jgi:hypothetical protein
MFQTNVEFQELHKLASGRPIGSLSRPNTHHQPCYSPNRLENAPSSRPGSPEELVARGRDSDVASVNSTNPPRLLLVDDNAINLKANGSG